MTLPYLSQNIGSFRSVLCTQTSIWEPLTGKTGDWIFYMPSTLQNYEKIWGCLILSQPWSIEFSTVVFTQYGSGFPRSQEALHFHYVSCKLLCKNSLQNARDPVWDLLRAKQAFCHWMVAFFFLLYLWNSPGRVQKCIFMPSVSGQQNFREILNGSLFISGPWWMDLAIGRPHLM